MMFFSNVAISYSHQYESFFQNYAVATQLYTITSLEIYFKTSAILSSFSYQKSLVVFNVANYNTSLRFALLSVVQAHLNVRSHSELVQLSAKDRCPLQLRSSCAAVFLFCVMLFFPMTSLEGARPRRPFVFLRNYSLQESKTKTKSCGKGLFQKTPRNASTKY